MKYFYNALVTEFIKLRRSRVPLVTIIFFIFIPLMMGLLMYLAQHPDIASKVGIIGMKASLFGENNWNSYFILINQIIAAIGIIGFGLVIGYITNLPGWSQQVFLENLSRFFVISGLTTLLSTPVALIASFGKGIVAPISFVIVMLILAQIVGLVGWGPYFPWSIPGVHSVPDGTPDMQLVLASYIIIIITFLAGFIGTISQWLHADQP
jgi:ABC-2 type transport system permease protein